MFVLVVTCNLSVIYLSDLGLCDLWPAELRGDTSVKCFQQLFPGRSNRGSGVTLSHNLSLYVTTNNFDELTVEFVRGSENKLDFLTTTVSHESGVQKLRVVLGYPPRAGFLQTPQLWTSSDRGFPAVVPQ